MGLSLLNFARLGIPSVATQFYTPKQVHNLKYHKFAWFHELNGMDLSTSFGVSKDQDKIDLTRCKSLDLMVKEFKSDSYHLSIITLDYVNNHFSLNKITASLLSHFNSVDFRALDLRKVEYFLKPSNTFRFVLCSKKFINKVKILEQNRLY